MAFTNFLRYNKLHLRKLVNLCLTINPHFFELLTTQNLYLLFPWFATLLIAAAIASWSPK